MQANSPAINAGNPNYIVGANETEFDGANRIYNSIVDCGAYEYSGTTSLSINNDNQTILVYPNPANAYVQIQSVKYAIQNIQVLDISGEIIAQYQEIENNTFFKINTSTLKNGIYFIKIKTNGMFFNKRIIID